MGKIQELSEQLANQIAAGEVIERPASVVKELIENAIDAGSTQIDIIIEESGLKKIQIIDNGFGIAPDDVVNAFKRHATSKIHSRDDLFRIRTLGFRGEALPSIASVSEILLMTSTGENQGTSISLKGGKIEEQHAHSMRKGTDITVSNLFFNTPARLKYIKSLQTELANIGDIVNRLAMSHPTIAFKLIHDGNKMLETTGNGDLKQTLAGIYGVAIAKKMLTIHSENLDFSIDGFISLPEVTRASRNYMSIMVNGRYIKNFLLNKAIVEGYRSKLMVGRFPIVAIEIKMDPLLVDVNVHPTKQEVRISKEKELMVLIQEAIHQRLSTEQLIPNAIDNLATKKRSVDQGEKPEQMRIYLDAVKESVKEQPYMPQSVENNAPSEPQASAISYPETELEELIGTTDTVVHETLAEDVAYVPSEKEKIPHRGEVITDEVNLKMPMLDYVGQMHGTYLFAQNEEGLYIIDQHAAQERIKYEYYRQKIGEVGRQLQDLLVPITLDFPNSDFIKLSEHKELLEEVGVFLEPFGQNSFLIRSHPSWFPKGQEEEILRDLIDILLESGKVNIAKFREDTAIMMSCKKSIKANHHLNDLEARTLLEDLRHTQNPFNCPHGRPVLIHYSNKDMERMFKRIQDPH
ncbi:DNA mismatch repair endonuclease MutL [Isobaculum melis]|uniref:DNA mismatch repair protein MutL n=1 Tax=Isobaculum melis TaxID=142588 RepID=A0A1H9RG23_9LACT|nr:DNA mismatch repair endonuclease MutL [Isobaculum melis]SER71750.1 DNA mismatch repair protein MutL [Isobaculum melis]